MEMIRQNARPKNVTASRENFTALQKNFTASRENGTAIHGGNEEHRYAA